MRIWFQLLASETGMQNSIAATQTICDKAASPGTIVEVHGTSNGALGDNYRLFWHYDTREVIANGLKVRQSGQYDAFVIANSLDPGLVELREVLDIPVTSFMEVCCHTACMMGEKFGIIVSNEKFIHRYREIAIGYGLRERLAAVEATRFDNIRDLNTVFGAGESADKLNKEANVVIQDKEVMNILAQEGVAPAGGTPDQFIKVIASDIQRWAKVVKQAKVTVE